MRILVLNSGSSSIKFSMFDAPPGTAEPTQLFDGGVSGVGSPQARIEIKSSDPALNLSRDVQPASTFEAGKLVLDAISRPGSPPPEAIGYRVVHPGPKLTSHVRINDEVLRDIEGAVAFAPLHDPAVIEVIREAMQRFPGIGHFACFDTVFHQTMPEEATVYPIPSSYRDQGVHRYGFHGLSCESIVRQLRANLPAMPQRLVIAHLGSGCSVTALRDGRSVDTTMGLTPTGGIVMGTRPGDLDPGLLLYLLRQQTGSKEAALGAVETLLNHDSGLVGLTHLPNDVKAIRAAAHTGDPQAALALNVFTRSVRKAIGSFSWILGGLDMIVFTGGIGEHDALTRSETLRSLETLGVRIEPTLNAQNSAAIRTISASDSATTVLVVPAQEDLTIALHVRTLALSAA